MLAEQRLDDFQLNALNSLHVAVSAVVGSSNINSNLCVILVLNLLCTYIVIYSTTDEMP